MRVKSCSAEAENTPAIQLTDEHGCVLRPKMISKFMKIAGADERASVVTYAFFQSRYCFFLLCRIRIFSVVV